jgi:hypothetical protein
MTNEFEADWDLALSEKATFYASDPAFEAQFIIIAKDFEFSNMWKFVKSLGSDEYNLDRKLEDKFYEVLKENGCLECDSFIKVWDIASKTMIDDTYLDDEMFDDLSYRISFEAFFRTKIKFTNSEIFEQNFKDVIGTVERKSETVPSNKSSSGRKNNSLKNLLEQRIKRHKQMETHIKTLKHSDSNNVSYECKICGFQSKWLRKLFFTHVKPEHMAGSKKNKV